MKVCRGDGDGVVSDGDGVVSGGDGVLSPPSPVRPLRCVAWCAGRRELLTESNPVHLLSCPHLKREYDHIVLF